MARRHCLGWRRQRTSGATLRLSDASRGMAPNAPIILIVMVTGADCSMFREMHNSVTPQKNGLSHLQIILCQPQAPKVVYPPTVQRQNKGCCGTPVMKSWSWAPDVPSVVIEGRAGYETKGTAKFGENNLVMLSLQAPAN